MLEVILTFRYRGGTRVVAMSESRLTIGSGEDVTVSVDDAGLSRLHASINSDGERVWILDEGSNKGSFVNGEAVPMKGRALSDGDEIAIGDDTTVFVNFTRPLAVERTSRLTVPLVAAALLFAAMGLAAALASRRPEKSAGDNRDRIELQSSSDRKADLVPSEAVEARDSDAATAEPGNGRSPVEQLPQTAASAPSNGAIKRKPYREMSEEERLAFIHDECQQITIRISNSTQPEYFEDFALRQIKRWVDSYAGGRKKSGMWGVELNLIFSRTPQYAPLITRSFNHEGVPPIVGLYIVWIETAYFNYPYENRVRASGLFQFLPSTALQYNVDPSERTNVEKMAPAAARYMKERIAHFGGDAKGVALAIANYNRGGTRDDLRKVIDSENPGRSFWTLMANKERLDHYFRDENVDYVPRFFAAAIVGENPAVFGVAKKPVSSLN